MLKEKIDALDVDKKYGFPIHVHLASTTAATAANYSVFFTAPHALIIYRVIARWDVASSSGTLQLKRVPSGTAPASGSDILKTTINTAGTANTNVERKKFDFSQTLIEQGDSISLVSGGTLTNLDNLVVTIYAVPAVRGDHIT